MWGSDVSAQVVPLAQRAERGHIAVELWGRRCGRAPALSPGGREGVPGDVGEDGAGIQAISAAQPLLGGWGP